MFPYIIIGLHPFDHGKLIPRGYQLDIGSETSMNVTGSTYICCDSNELTIFTYCKADSLIVGNNYWEDFSLRRCC